MYLVAEVNEGVVCWYDSGSGAMVTCDQHYSVVKSVILTQLTHNLTTSLLITTLLTLLVLRLLVMLVIMMTSGLLYLAVEIVRCYGNVTVISEAVKSIVFAQLMCHNVMPLLPSTLLLLLLLLLQVLVVATVTRSLVVMLSLSDRDGDGSVTACQVRLDVTTWGITSRRSDATRAAAAGRPQ